MPTPSRRTSTLLVLALLTTLLLAVPTPPPAEAQRGDCVRMHTCAAPPPRPGGGGGVVTIPRTYTYYNVHTCGPASSSVHDPMCRRGLHTAAPTPAELSAQFAWTIEPYAKVGGTAQTMHVTVPSVALTDIACTAGGARCALMEDPEWQASVLLDVPDGYNGHEGARYPTSTAALADTDFRYELTRTTPDTLTRTAGYDLELEFLDTPPTDSRDPELEVRMVGDLQVTVWDLYNTWENCNIVTSYTSTSPPGGSDPGNRCGGPGVPTRYNTRTIDLPEAATLACGYGTTFQVTHPSVTR